MGRAVKESGGDPRRLVEIGIERDEEGGDQRQHVEERRSLSKFERHWMARSWGSLHPRTAGQEVFFDITLFQVLVRDL